MWIESLGDLLRPTQGPLTLVPVPVERGADWAYFANDPRASARTAADLPSIAAAEAHDGRVLVTLTRAARGQVVADLLIGRWPAEVGPAALDSEDVNLQQVQLAHARTAMLCRQAAGHRMTTSPAALRALWEAGGQRRSDDVATRRMLQILAGAHRARTRARAQRRTAPVVANLRALGTAFHLWFAQARCTPRGSLPPPGSPIMETYHLNLALAAATGAALRAGLGDLNRTAPENM